MRPDLGRCWVWTRYLNKGYGALQVGTLAKTKKVLAYKFSWELVNGPVPEGLELDHLCRNRACVRPSHLEPVTHQLNMLRGDTFASRQVQVTECPQGHPYDEKNTHVKSSGKRKCRACDRDRHREIRAARRAAA